MYYKEYPKEFLLNFIKAMADELGHNPTFNQVPLHLYRACKYHFETWDNTLIEAGLEVKHIRVKRNNITKETVLDMVENKIISLNRLPLTKDFSYSEYMQLYKIFGGITKAIIAVEERGNVFIDGYV